MMHKSILPLSLLGLFAFAFAPFGCSTESYCFDCPEAEPGQDAGSGGSSGSGGSGGSGGTGGIIDAGPADGFTVGNNPCGADLMNDPMNCGMCGFVCEIPNAFAKCEEGFCVIDRCASGFYDNNGTKEDGCEYECEPLRDSNGDPLPEETVCDLEDDDCDGLVDEVFDTDSDLQHCGGCNQPCYPPANATMKCVAGTCEFDACFEHYEDVN
ncbi:MAG: hypothetical protein ACOC1F_02115, partial [Myxococcota bacterium]